MATSAPPIPKLAPERTASRRSQQSRQSHMLRQVAEARPYGFIQPKLTVGPANDRFEREADAVADRVMRMDAPRRDAPSVAPSVSPIGSSAAGGSAQASRHSAAFASEPLDPVQPAWLCSGCSGTSPVERSNPEDDIQRIGGGGALGGRSELATRTEADIGVLQGGGQPLAAEDRDFFEPRFGTDFSNVRLHTDLRADRLAHALGAEAFTIGSHIAVRGGPGAVGSSHGRRLLAHELTHVIQQSGATRPAAGTIQRTIGDGHDLSAPRFAGNVTLEAAFDDELLIRRGASGAAVRLIQESLVAMGYPLPNSVLNTTPPRLDGIFGPETEAAIVRFQTDASALQIDGIVGPETMGLLDTHDVSRPTGRPPATVGPVQPPLAATDCDAHFTGVTFTLANQVATSATNAADIRLGVAGGRQVVSMQGRVPINYDPEVTITAPSNAAAANFRVGFTQTLLTSDRVANYSAGGQVRTVVPTLPIKDGDPNDYNPIFVTNLVPSIVEDFSLTGETIALNWPDVPGDRFFVNLLDNPSCAGSARPAQVMTSMMMLDTFRIWTLVQHRPSGCVRALHHVDWRIIWLAIVTGTGAARAVTPLFNLALVTEPNGNGSPGFVQGGPVPGAIAVKRCT